MKTKTQFNHSWIAAVIAALLFATLGTLAQQVSKSELQYRDALNKEQIQGDLNGAIKIYQGIADSKNADKAVRAKALLQLAGCYEKLGKQAESVYLRIVNEFADQPAAVQAKAKLGPSSSAGLAKRLLCADCNNANVSRDGRWIVFPRLDQDDLLIRDLSTGQDQRLKAQSADDDGSRAAGPDLPVFSPDHRRIIYVWWAAEKGALHSQLRLISNEQGSRPRVLIDNPEYNYYDPAGWFPDGQSALVILHKLDDTKQLARVSVSDGTVKVLKPLEWRLFNLGNRPVSLSPDGRYIAYAASPVNPSVNPSKVPHGPAYPKEVHIYVLAADGSSEAEIVKTAGVNSDPGWATDGKHVLFTSDRSGKTDLWSIAIQNGKAAGPESLISRDIGEIADPAMAGGSYYYGNHTQRWYIHVVESGARETDKIIGVGPRWSPDGKSIAFKRRHPEWDPRDYDIVIHSLETGEEKTLLAGIGTSGPGAPIWSRDGLSILTGVKRGDSPNKLTRVDLRTGDFKELHAASWGLGPGALSRDEKTLYVVRPPEGQTPSRVVADDLDTNEERVVFSLTQTAPSMRGTSIAVSPDGRTLALGWVENPPERTKLHIARVSVDGSGFREVFTRTDHLAGAFYLAWDPDGRSILFDQGQPRGAGASPWGVMRVPADGGPATLVTTARSIEGFDLSPDGSRYAYSVNERSGELWALDNVLPTLK